MIKRIKKNQQFSHKSWIYQLNPAIKIFCFLFLLIITFLPSGFLGLILLFGWTILLYVTLFFDKTLWKKHLKSFFKMFLYVSIFIFILFLIDWFSYRQLNQVTQVPSYDLIWGHLPPNAYYQYFQITFNVPIYGLNHAYAISLYSIVIVVYVYVKLIIIICLIQILVKSTNNIDLINGFRILLTPLKWIKVPVDQLCLILSLTIRFIPNLIKTAKQIYLAQKSRGAYLSKNKVWNKLKMYYSTIVPLFALTFQKTNNLADALETKHYVNKNKKHYFYHYKLSLNDLVYSLVSLSLCSLLIYMLSCHVFFANFGVANSLIQYGEFTKSW